MEPRIRIKCMECDSTDVANDGWISWNEELQMHEVHSIFDNAYCFNCQGEANLYEENIDE